MKEERRGYYIYIYLDNRKPEVFRYKEWEFNYTPFYVGRGRGKRIEEHLSEWSLANSSHKNFTIKSIIKETGNEPIRFKLYENLTLDEANKIEEEVIEYFGRKNIGTGILTNLRDGGAGKNWKPTVYVKKKLSDHFLGKYTPRSKRVDQFDLEGNFIRKWECISDIQNELGFSANCIRGVCLGKHKTSFGFVWKFDGTSPYIKPNRVDKSTSKQEIFQYDCDGNKLKSFPSITLAAESLNIQDSNINCICSGIGACASGLQNRAFGFRWFYEDQGEKIEMPPLVNGKLYLKMKVFPVSAYEKIGGEKKLSFSSINEAHKFFGSNKSSYIKTICGTGKRYKGYFWELD